MKRFLVLCLLTFVCSSVGLHASGAPNAKRQPKPQEVYAAYWTAEPGWHTEIQLRNNYAEQSLDVQTVLRTANGAEISLPAVTIAPDDTRVIDVRSVLAIAAPKLQPSDAYGSVVFRYSSKSPGNIFANVMVHRDGEPIGFHFDAYGADANAMQSEESVWWLPRDSTQAFVLVANVSQSNATAHVRVSAPDGTAAELPLLLGPGEMGRLSLREVAAQITSAAQFGGISVAASPPGALAVNVIEYDDSVGFGANLTVFDRGLAGPPETTTIRAPMIALAQPGAELGFPASVTLNPQLFVRNPTAHPLPVGRTVNWRSVNQTGSASYPALLLAPGETQSVSLAPDSQIPPEANWATVALTYDGHYGDLVAVAASYSADGSYGAQSPFSPNLAPRWKGSRWVVDDTHDSLITAGNGGSKPTRLGVTIFYNGGTGKYTMAPKSLAPGEQVWLDMSHLIRDQVPDAKGQTLPIDLSSGTYELQDLDDPSIGSIYEGKLTLDRTYGQAAYGCSLCCGWDAAWIAPLSFTGNVGNSTPDVVWAEQYCTGIDEDETSISYGWASSNTSVTSVTFAFTSLIGAGSANTLASVNLKTPSGPKTCAIVLYAMTAGVTVSFPSQVEPIYTASQGPAQCTQQGQAGWLRNTTNQVQYSNGSPYSVAGLDMADTLTPSSTNALGITSAETGHTPTTGDGSFPDVYYVCSSACPSSTGESDATQQWTLNGVALSHANGVVYKCGSITIDGR